MRTWDVLWAGLAVLAVTLSFSAFWADLSAAYNVTPPDYIQSVQTSAQSFRDLGERVKTSFLSRDPINDPLTALGAIFNFFKFVLFDLTKMILFDAPAALQAVFNSLAAVLHVPTELVSMSILAIVLAVIWGVLSR